MRAAVLALAVSASTLALGSSCGGSSSEPRGSTPPDGGTHRDGSGDSSAPPESCAGLTSALSDFAQSHQACERVEDCRTLDELYELELCSLAFSPGADEGALRPLLAEFEAQGCGGDTMCGYLGQLACQGGKCAFVDQQAGCEACPMTLAPVCTKGGQNARNECFARECLHDEVAHEGYCESSASCVARGGTCHPRQPNEWLCPDGTRFDPLDESGECPGGNFENFCCTGDWSPPCTYFGALSLTLSRDPFTCEPVTDGNVCLFASSPGSCELTAKIEVSSGAQTIRRLDDGATIFAEPGARATITGHAPSGRTFTCHGVVSANDEDDNAWSCTTCLGPDCKTCTISQSYRCRT